jgi:hypothetical protein
LDRQLELERRVQLQELGLEQQREPKQPEPSRCCKELVHKHRMHLHRSRTSSCTRRSSKAIRSSSSIHNHNRYRKSQRLRMGRMQPSQHRSLVHNQPKLHKDHKQPFQRHSLDHIQPKLHMDRNLLFQRHS